VPELPEFGARNANSFGKAGALPWAFSARSVLLCAFFAARGATLRKNGGSKPEVKGSQS
jgi:hypothetical protein